MAIGHLIPAKQCDESEWVRTGIVGFTESVLSIVPAGYEAYARIFHPAALNGVPVRWRDVAKATNRVDHPAMQWPSIMGVVSDRFSMPGVWDQHPPMGSLPRSELAPLVDILRKWTSTPEQCFFGVWEGYGALSPSVRSAPTFDLPNRRYHLMEGPVEGLLDDVEDPPWHRSANLCWPADRAWLVASEIDFVSTYVGGSRTCIYDLVQSDQMETAEVRPSDGVRWADDLLNPAPDGA